MAAPAEILPPGNVWEFSERNYAERLQPGPGKVEIAEPQGRLLEVVHYIQAVFIKPEWRFTSLIQDLGSEDMISTPHLIAIFTHPARTVLVESLEDVSLFVNCEGIKPKNKIRYELDERFSEQDLLNLEVFKDTNCHAQGYWTSFNGIFVDEGFGMGQKGVIPGKSLVVQTGVGFFDLELLTSEERIARLSEELDNLQMSRQAMEVLQSPNPVPLFQ